MVCDVPGPATPQPDRPTSATAGSSPRIHVRTAHRDARPRSEPERDAIGTSAGGTTERGVVSSRSQSALLDHRWSFSTTGGATEGGRVTTAGDPPASDRQ